VWLLLVTFAHAQVVAPFQGLGNVQFFDNNGKPLTSGVLYSFQAGTSTQQATYTDYTGLFPNPNPIPFGSGARISIWLLSGAYYKFVLCSQNDGAFCAPADVLFSVDQVPGSGASGSSGSPFIGTFISGSANPSTAGILRLASGDSICWRNVANTGNLCISKDTNDLLSWAGGSLKFPEVSAPTGVANFDLLWADSAAHRWKMANNGGGALQLVAAGVDINTSDQVTQLHFGSTAAPLTGSLTTNYFVQWNGSQLTTAAAIQPLLIANDTGSGTTVNRLTKVTGAPSAAVMTGTSDKSGILGITIAGAGLTGTATIQQSGLATCDFDGATTAGDYFINSTTSAGQCHDYGFTPGGLGRVLSTNGGAGSYQVVLNIGPGGQQLINRNFSQSGCSPPTSTDSSCSGTVNISPALPDASYTPQLTLNSINGAFLAISVSGSLTSSSIPYTITCTFNCGSISTPTIYVHLEHP
jgi:hypothetical protein